jgi:CHAP domain
MSLHTVIARIAQIDEIFSPRPPAATRSTGASGFLSALDGVQHSSALAVPAAAPVSGAGTAGQRAVAAAQVEVGVAEQPPGSNDAPRIAEYRTATAGSGVGPWCAYFTSWCASQAGAPLGEVGQGFGAVEAVYGWAQRTGRAMPAGPGVVPSPGDLIVWGGRHIGIVESVDPDGSIHTIEGNSSNAVSRRTYGPDGGGATGYVRLG